MKPTLPKGHTSILSPTFKYVHSNNTDVAKTFERVREEMKQKPANVRQLKGTK